MDPQIEKLLTLQDSDSQLASIEREIARIPKEREALTARIEDERGRIESARGELKQMEVRRNELDTDVKEREAQVARYRNQQLEVKKNEEYRALTHEIEKTESEISGLEEREIELMLEIDGAREAFESEKAVIEGRIEDLKKRQVLLDEREGAMKAELDGAKSAYEASRNGIEEAYLSAYDRVRPTVRTGGVVVQIREHKCSGCHLRVSNETEKASRHPGEVHICDQCGRIVYQ